jgi:hypothetical protein
MKILSIILIMLIASITQAMPNTPKECIRYEKRLENIQTELRRGYKANRGNQLRKQRREQEEKLSDCEKKYK